jgi:diadenosine tetraphosphate (Ap4A) HIT family hydrolase
MADMGVLGDALKSVSGAVRINYAIFGNVEPALHAHVFPRRADEPAEIRTAQPWALDWLVAPSFNDARHDGFKARLLQELRRLGAVR